MPIPKHAAPMPNVANHLRGYLYALGELGSPKEEVEFFAAWIDRVDELWIQRNAQQPVAVNFASVVEPPAPQEPSQ